MANGNERLLALFEGDPKAVFTVKEIAKKLKMPTKSVSARLSMLKRDGYIHNDAGRGMWQAGETNQDLTIKKKTKKAARLSADKLRILELEALLKKNGISLRSGSKQAWKIVDDAGVNGSQAKEIVAGIDKLVGRYRANIADFVTNAGIHAGKNCMREGKRLLSRS